MHVKILFIGCVFYLIIMSEENENNKITIDNYIKNNNCEINQTRTEYLDGEAIILQGYRLPRELLYYNIKNGRFAKEYIKIIRDQGGSLKPEDQDDAKKIQKLLVGLKPNDTRRTKEDIEKKGQTELGIITRDGYLIDGNRRMAILADLFADTSDEKYNFIKVARIENAVSAKDLWAMEAGISLGQDPKSRYGAINELLKLDEGRKAGFTNKEIADKLYGIDDESEIKDKLERLDLMRKYLKKYYDDEEDFTPIEGYNEHFIDVQDIMQSAEKNGKSVDEKVACLKVGFRLIHDQVPHMRIRTINQAIKNDYSLEKIIGAADQMEEVKEVTIDPTLEEEPSTDTVVRFIDFEDEVKAKKNEGQTTLILNSILNNFAVLKFESEDLKTDVCKELTRKILEYSKKLDKNTEN
jgi:hypothetical protein